jgi:ubiquinone/menaquinone biosynthesis C-methylase UbiE
MAMNYIILLILISLAIVTALTFAWRYASRRRTMPCPVWMSSLLENPYMDAFASASVLLNRAGVGPGMRLLDAGCGPGRLTIPAAKRVGPSGQVVAADIQPGMLQRMKERAQSAGLDNIQPILGGIGRGMLPKSAFDRAFLITVLGEIPEQERFAGLMEIYDSLKPGGILSVTEVFPDPHYQSRAKVLRFCESAGFRSQAQYGNWLAFTINFVKQ